MGKIAKLFFSVICLFSLSTAPAQKPKQATVDPVAEQKNKLPKLISSLGNLTDSATLFVEEAVQLIKLPIKVTDDKKNNYTITSYQVMYRRKAVTENEETGKVSPVISNVSALFRSTPLTPLWQITLTKQLKPGEELYFFDIVAKEKNGRLLFAPDLKLNIK